MAFSIYKTGLDCRLVHNKLSSRCLITAWSLDQATDFNRYATVRLKTNGPLLAADFYVTSAAYRFALAPSLRHRYCRLHARRLQITPDCFCTDFVQLGVEVVRADAVGVAKHRQWPVRLLGLHASRHVRQVLRPPGFMSSLPGLSNPNKVSVRNA